MMLSATWKAYFISRADNERGNQNTSIYTTAWAKEVPRATKLSILVSNPDTILFAADTDGTLIALHSFANLGGTLLRPVDKFVCLTGSGHVGVPLIVDEQSATEEVDFKAPSVDLIIANPATTVQGTTHYDYIGCSTFLPAPWLSDAIISTISNDPYELMLVATSAAKAFDLAHHGDPAYLTTAESHLKEFVAWAWGVKNNKVPSTSYRLGLTDAQLQSFHEDRHRKCIAPNNPSLAHAEALYLSQSSDDSSSSIQRQHLQCDNPNQKNNDNNKKVTLRYEKNGWTRTIRATTDMKFIWTRLDEIGNVDQRTRFDTERSAYVRKMHYVREEDGRVREWCSLVTPDRVAVDSYVENSEGEKIVTYRDIVSAQMMSYDDKVEWFHATCKQLNTEGVIMLAVRRDNLLDDSINSVMSVHPMHLRKPWMIRFQDEPGLDANGGLMREWFELVKEQLFTPAHGLWKNTSNNKWQINPFSGLLCEKHLTYFRFIGRLMGRAIFTGQLVKGHMEKHFYKHVLGFPIMFNDLKDLDEEYFNRLKGIENCRNTKTAAEFESLHLDFTFTVEEDAALLPNDPKDEKKVELVPDGAQLNVTHENIPEYIEACLKYHVMGRYEAQLNEILVGIYEVVPEALFTIFDFQELELLMCGLPEIDLDDWMDNTVYEGVYKIPGSSHMVCRWFWEIVREYDHELKARLLQFVTGTRGVPSRGFGYLTDHNGIRKFTIMSIPYPVYKFPRSHTCFNRIDLPVYSTREELEKYLKIAITMAATGFDIE